jgi:hypothetical protein
MKYLIFNISEIDKVNFDEVRETSKDTIRMSIDGTKTFIKWDENETPSFISLLTTAEGIYSQEEILEILSTDLWSDLSHNYNIIYKTI